MLDRTDSSFEIPIQNSFDNASRGIEEQIEEEVSLDKFWAADDENKVKESVEHLLDGVMNTGTPYHGYEIMIPLVRNGKLGNYYFDFWRMLRFRQHAAVA